MNSLDDQARHIAKSIAASGHYATYDRVLQNLLGWHGVPSFTLLPLDLRMGGTISGPLDNMVLRHLYDIEQRLHTFVTAFVGARNLATLHDLEGDATRMLRTFLVPPLKDVRASPVAQLLLPNPEEIDIDAGLDGGSGDPVACSPVVGIGEASPQVVSFQDMGIGPLRNHPTVEACFGPVAADGRQISESTVLAHLLGFLSVNGGDGGDGRSEAGDVSVPLFAAYVAREEGASCLADLGVLIRHTSVGHGGEPRGLGAECQMLRHVVQAKARRHAEAVIKLLRDAGLSSTPDAPLAPNLDSAALRARSQKKPAAAPAAGPHRLPDMPRPTRPLLARFVDACAAGLGDSTYTPTFSRMQQVVLNVAVQGFTGAPGGKSCSEHGNGKKRKGQPLDSASGVPRDESTHEVLLDVATEYAMLHFGGSKYRSRAAGFQQSGGVLEDEQAVAKECEAELASVNEERAPCSSSSSSSSNSRSSSEESSSEEESAASPQPKPDAPTAKNDPREDEACGNDARRGVGSESAAGCWDIVVRPPSSSRPLDAEAPGDGYPGGGVGCTPGEPAAEGPGGWLRLPWGLPPLDRRDFRAVGRWGEAFVHQLLLQRFPPWTGASVEWVNEREETRAAYDLKITFPSARASSSSGGGSGSSGGGGRARRPGETIFVEVKTTASADKATFDLSLQEWEFATSVVGGGGGRLGCRSGSSLVAYHVYRVFGAGDPGTVRVSVVKDIVAAIEAKRVRLCLALK